MKNRRNVLFLSLELRNEGLGDLLFNLIEPAVAIQFLGNLHCIPDLGVSQSL